MRHGLRCIAAVVLFTNFSGVVKRDKLPHSYVDRVANGWLGIDKQPTTD